MACTHTIEVQIGSINVQGELDFDSVEDGAPTLVFKLDGTLEESLHQSAIFQQFLCCLNQMHVHIGEIIKLEVVPK